MNWIGCNVIICAGTTIGNNNVIGAGAVLRGKYGNNSIIIGNPAKEIKKIKKNN